jgi:uncharacterized protein (TIGR03382 family)
MKLNSIYTLAGLAAVAASAGSALAFVPWDQPNGAGSNFTWANGGSREGRFGNPVLVNGNTFVFFPSNFRAQSVNGSASVVGDRLEFDLFANAGFLISGIRISEFGDYGIVGEGGQVSASGGLFVTNLNTGATLDDEIVTNPGSPIQGEGFGNWNGEAGVDLSGQNPGWTRIHVVVDNDLVAISGAGGVAFIEKKVFGSGVSITIVPTPGSMALLAAGSVLAFRRRR